MGRGEPEMWTGSNPSRGRPTPLTPSRRLRFVARMALVEKTLGDGGISTMCQIKRMILCVGMIGMLGAGGWSTAHETKAGDDHGARSSVNAIGKCTYANCT